MSKSFQPYYIFGVVIALSCISLSWSKDVFDNVDQNNNGVIERQEFSNYVVKLRSMLDPMIDLTSASSSNAVPSVSVEEYVIGLMGSGTNFIHGFVHSLVVILITEIGDKTFFIAAVLAMRNARFVVYLGSMTALAAMHILSSLMGFALPALLPRTYTHFASILLFIYFGIKLLKDSFEMKSDGPSDELNEVEEELIAKNKEEEDDTTDDLERSKNSINNNSNNTTNSSSSTTPNRHNNNNNNNNSSKNKSDNDSSIGYHHDDDDDDNSTGKKKHSNNNNNNNSIQQFFRNSENLKVFTQALTLTFVAEWGDRSQIATIALAASKNIMGVIIGGLIGHAFCTGLAVVGGRLLAARISEKTVALIGGILFLCFAIHSFAVGA